MRDPFALCPPYDLRRFRYVLVRLAPERSRWASLLVASMAPEGKLVGTSGEWLLFLFDSFGFPPLQPARGRWNGDRLVLGTGLAVMVLGPVISAAATGAAGIGLGRGAAGVGAVAMIVSSTSSFGRASQDVDGRPAPAMTMGQGRGFIQGGSANGRCGTHNDRPPIAH